MVSSIDARTMRFAIIAVLLMMYMVYAANDTQIEEEEKEKKVKEQTQKEKEDLKRLRILYSRNLAVMDVSSVSKDQFTDYMAGYCLMTEHMSQTDYINSYIDWDKIEFLDGVKAFLDPADNDPIKSYFNHLGHYTVSNCSMINEKEKRDIHHLVAQQALFDNYMYDQMTRNEWTRLHL